MNNNRIITSLCNELDAARRLLRKETQQEKRAELVGYIRGLQVAMLAVRNSRVSTF